MRYAIFKVERIHFKWKPIVAIMRNRKNIGILFLMMGMFFCPIGFDAATAVVMKWTRDYWTTMSIFYLLSASFFGAYFFVAKINVFKYVKNRFNSLKSFLRNLF